MKSLPTKNMYLQKFVEKHVYLTITTKLTNWGSDNILTLRL